MKCIQIIFSDCSEEQLANYDAYEALHRGDGWQYSSDVSVGAGSGCGIQAGEYIFKYGSQSSGYGNGMPFYGNEQDRGDGKGDGCGVWLPIYCG